MRRFLFACCVCACGATAQDKLADRITAQSLRGRVSFLASDFLEGRATPSRGLDVAADYIASEFRRAGLESPQSDNFAQSAPFILVSDYGDSLHFGLSRAGTNPVSVDAGDIAVTSLRGGRLVNQPVFKWAPGVTVAEPLQGKVLILRAPSDPSTIAKLALNRPDAIVQLIRKPLQRNWRINQLASVSQPTDGPIVISVPESGLEATFDRLPTGLTNARASLNVDPPVITPIEIRNAIGDIPGSDPKLRNEYIIVSAHYDHLGLAELGSDRIFNGANDDASGVATVIELAHALARENPHPKRTIVFVCFFGEERGLLGSRWYVNHPLFPLARTIADLNFEHMGEPGESLPAGSLGVTGFGFSEVPEMIADPLAAAGVTLKESDLNEDSFRRSDNYTFAQAGIPAHTFLASFDFPEYHRVTDEWRNLNYDNMALLARGAALAIMELANRPDSPNWTESEKTKDFRSAWQALHPQS